VSDGGSSEAAGFRRVAGRFSEVVGGVHGAAWSNPAPCEGWTALDVVRHLVEWVPGFFERGAITLPTSTAAQVEADPAAAWGRLRDALQAILDDPASTVDEIDVPPVGRHTVAAAIAKFVTGDVLVHTWDLARAVGVDVTLDPELAAAMLAGIEPIADLLASSGHYNAAVPVAPGTNVQDRLIAATGRDPEW
jgi:uncharacterized protein (TIGR03086 family)